MNISDFLYTVAFSLLTGVGLGLTIKTMWFYLMQFLTRRFFKTKALKQVDFGHFFGEVKEEQ